MEHENKNNEIILNYFSENLPHFNYFEQNWHHEYKKCSAFYEKGFCNQTMRTCIIENIENIEKIRKNFSKNRKYDLNKADDEKLIINYDIKPDFFYEEHKRNLIKRGLKINYSKKLLKRIFESTKNNNCGKIIGVLDKNQSCQALSFVIWDSNYAYLIGLTTNPKTLKSGASAFLIYKSIDFLIGKTKNFDFEGSMNDNIYKFYKSFGSIKKEYYKITNYKPKLLKKIFELIRKN